MSFTDIWKKQKFLKVSIKTVIYCSEKAVIYISADDYYKLYINGKFVASGPAPSYYNSYNYNKIDVSDFLINGENTIAVHTYYQGLINRVWVSGDNCHGLISLMK